MAAKICNTNNAGWSGIDVCTMNGNCYKCQEDAEEILASIDSNKPYNFTFDTLNPKASIKVINATAKNGTPYIKTI